MQISELIADQARTLAVMFCCGIFVESLWQGKRILRRKTDRRILLLPAEAGFWAASAAALSAFLYYGAFGKISFHAMLGFLAGLLLWKKICCVIMNAKD